MYRPKPHAVADTILPALVTFVIARKQARWQWKHAADEHKHEWTVVVQRLDARIARGEKALGQRMEMTGFRMKREIVE